MLFSEDLPELAGIHLPNLEVAFAESLEHFPVELARHYPGIVHQIDRLWGSRKAVKFLDGLRVNKTMLNSNMGEALLREVTELRQLHDRLYADKGNYTDNQKHPKKEARAFASPAVSSEASSYYDDEIYGDDKESITTRTWPEIADGDALSSYTLERMCSGMMSLRDQRKLGDILVKYGVLTIDALTSAVTEASIAHEPLGRYLVEQGLLDHDDLIRALCVQDGIPSVNLKRVVISDEAMEKITLPVAQAKRVVPIALLGKHLFLAVEDPTAFVEKPYFSFMTSCNIELLHANRADIEATLASYERNDSRESRDSAVDKPSSSTRVGADACLPEIVHSGLILGSSTPDVIVVDNLIDQMISDALSEGATDIHIEARTGAQLVQVRTRRSGRMVDHSSYPFSSHAALSEKLKKLAGFNSAEKHEPQTGKIEWHRDTVRRNLRLTVMPVYGDVETLVINVLPLIEVTPLEQLGLNADHYKWLRTVFRQSAGVFLVAGPVKTGKIMTLYSVIDHFNDGSRKIWTIEDPVELVLPGISQFQIGAEIGWSTAAALRVIGRADPDVIMINDLDETEALRLAINHSMNGVWIFSALHATSAVGAFARLANQVTIARDLSNVLTAVLMQRYVSRICNTCGQTRKLEETELDNLASEWCRSSERRLPLYDERQQTVARWKEVFGNQGSLAVKIPQGCSECHGRGFKGQIGIFEMLPVTPEIRSKLIEGGDESEFLEIAARQGMKTLQQDGIEKVFRGLTTFEQIRSICS